MKSLPYYLFPYLFSFALKDGQLWLGHQQTLMVSQCYCVCACVCVCACMRACVHVWCVHAHHALYTCIQVNEKSFDLKEVIYMYIHVHCKIVL